MELLARLNGEGPNLIKLSLQFNQPELSILEFENCFYIKSVNFNNKTIDEIYELAKSMAKNINSLFYFQMGYRDSFEVVNITKVDDGVGVIVDVLVNVGVTVGVSVTVGVGVSVGVVVRVGVMVGVGVTSGSCSYSTT